MWHNEIREDHFMQRHVIAVTALRSEFSHCCNWKRIVKVYGYKSDVFLYLFMKLHKATGKSAVYNGVLYDESRFMSCAFLPLEEIRNFSARYIRLVCMSTFIKPSNRCFLLATIGLVRVTKVQQSTKIIRCFNSDLKYIHTDNAKD